MDLGHCRKAVIWAGMRTMPQPTLQTRRLTLVPLSDEHIDLELELDADPEVVRYVNDGQPRTRAQVEEAHVSRMACADVPGLGLWVGSTSEEPVGWWVLLAPRRPDQGPVEGQAEVGYRLLPRWWGQGLAREGTEELIRYAFEDLGLSRVFAETMAVNTRSRGVMEAVGMTFARSFDNPWEVGAPGADQGEVAYEVTREGWLATHSRAWR
jgi:RimJ/RimL family protein N-acetyltransferase